MAFGDRSSTDTAVSAATFGHSVLSSRSADREGPGWVERAGQSLGRAVLAAVALVLSLVYVEWLPLRSGYHSVAVIDRTGSATMAGPKAPTQHHCPEPPLHRCCNRSRHHYHRSFGILQRRPSKYPHLPHTSQAEQYSPCCCCTQSRKCLVAVLLWRYYCCSGSKNSFSEGGTLLQ